MHCLKCGKMEMKHNKIYLQSVTVDDSNTLILLNYPTSTKVTSCYL